MFKSYSSAAAAASVTQDLWRKRLLEFTHTSVVCSCNLILYCILSSAAVPSWFSSIFPSSSSFPSSFVLLQSPFPHKRTDHFFFVFFFPTRFCTQELQRELSSAINYAHFPIWKQRAEKTWVEVSLETELWTWIMRLMRMYVCGQE